ncbi:MAG: NUDIX domain-containing protein [Bacteroidia bacterium]
MQELTVIKEKTVFDDTFVIKKGEITTGDKTFSKLYLKREDAVALFILNTDSDMVILTRQFRYPIAGKTKEHILEIVAGKIEGEDEPLLTALRETEEETGYKIEPRNIRPLFSCFSSPGYSAERFFIYYATVTNANKIAEGGGKKSENEYIEVVPIKRNEFFEFVKNGGIKDAKTLLAAMYLKLNGYLNEK